MSSVKQRTEDEVRDSAKIILGFDKVESQIKQGTGQITTFKQLGFTGKNSNHKPDGWYLPYDTNKIAIILETKSELEDLHKQKWEKELFDNIDVVNTKYKNIVGILYNGKEQRIFINKVENTPPM